MSKKPSKPLGIVGAHWLDLHIRNVALSTALVLETNVIFPERF